jgi:hypothetical protein
MSYRHLHQKAARFFLSFLAQHPPEGKFTVHLFKNAAGRKRAAHKGEAKRKLCRVYGKLKGDDAICPFGKP